LRRTIATTLLALGSLGLIRAAETASSTSTSPQPAVAQAAPAAPGPAKAPATPAAASPTAAAPAAAPATPAPAAAPATPAPVPGSPAAGSTATPKADSAKAKPAKKLSKKAKAAADSTAKADSLKAAAAADSLKAAQAKAAADSAAAAARAAAVADSLRADSTQRAAKAADSAKVAAAADSAAADSAAAKGKKRKRIVRETTVNTIDELKGRYRSPKKALFMSLIVPGLGQAYVGHHWFNYTRGAAYLLTDVALAYGWHYYVGTKQDNEIKKYKAFADQYWRQSKYEDTVNAYTDKVTGLFPHRANYCEYVQDQSGSGQALYQGCADPQKNPVQYSSFRNVYNDAGINDVDSIGSLRAGFPNSQQFYELIGKEVEFIHGWDDAPASKMSDTAFYAVDDKGNVLKGREAIPTSEHQQKYITMRAQANDYARMQAWFLGGMVVNHIVSAIDAALTAKYHNKALYQTETYWYDRIHLDSQLAWDGYAPVPTVTASVTF
jgi:hypothetical protein